METSLDIHVNFPEVDPSKTESHAEHVPVVLLLGWAGCKDKYLQKYSKIYEDKGFITVRYSAPVSHVFWDRSGVEESSKDIVKFLHDMKFDEHPVFVHLFSNGGAFLYEHLSKDLRKGPQPIRVKGVIFDSCPGERRVHTLFLVMQEIFGKTTLIGPLIATFIFLIVFSLYILRAFYFKAKERVFGYSPGSDPFRALSNDDVTYPHLLFFSKKDHLILCKDVEYFANCRENLGNYVTKICFDDSLHVKHFMKHPEVYKNSINKFMDECLNG